MADDDPAECGRHDTSDGVVFETISERLAELIGTFWMLQYERALYVGAAVASAGKLKVPRADGAYLFEEFENFVALHGSLSDTLPSNRGKRPVALA